MNTQNEQQLGGKRIKPFDLIGAVRRSVLLVIVLGSVLLMCLAPVAVFMSKPYFDATGRIQIERVQQTFIASSESRPISNYFYDFAQTQVQRIKQYGILEKAVESLTVEERISVFGGNVPPRMGAVQLERRMVVGLLPSTHLIMLHLTGGNPGGLAEALNAVMKAYLGQAAADEEAGNERRLSFLQEERKQLETEINDLNAQIMGYVRTTRTSAFMEEYNYESGALQEMQKAYVRALQTRLDSEAHYNETRLKVANIKKLSPQALADELVAGDESLWSISYWTYKTLQEMRASIDGVATSNPDRQYVEERMQAMKDYESNLKQAVGDRALRIVTDKRSYELDRELIEAEHQYKAALEAETVLKHDLEERMKRSAANSERIVEAQDLAKRLEHARDKLFLVDRRIQEIRAESRAPMRIFIEQYARPPLDPAGNNFKKLFMLVFAASFGMVGMIFMGHEFLDGRMQSAKDMENALGVRPSWPISDTTRRGPFDVPFERLVLDAPASAVSKALRSLAIRLDREREAHGAKVAMFTGVDPGSGVTGLSINTAQAMTAFCQRVLYVDAGLTGSGLGELYGDTAKGPGLMDAMLGQARWSECVFGDSERGIDVLPLGNATPRRIVHEELSSIIGEMREAYDFIILDTSPVLASDLTEFLALRSDIGVMVAQGGRTLYSQTRFAASLLLRLEIPAFAPVLNWGGQKSYTMLERIILRVPLLWRLRL